MNNKHKGVKVMWNGSPLKEIYPHATKWQMFKYHVRIFLLRTLVISILLGSIYTAFKVGQSNQGVVIYTQPEIITVENKAPILDRIAKCESPNGQYDKNGQVALNANKDGTVDIGKYQINNKVWGKKATEMHLNLANEEDNATMAKWIYENRGTEDWYSSKACWIK